MASHVSARIRLWRLAVFAVGLGLLGTACTRRVQAPDAGNIRFEITVPTATRETPVTGRVFVVISRDETPEPRLQAGSWVSVPFFGTDVVQLKPGTAAVIDGRTLGYPLKALRDIPPGDYDVQAVLNVYTEFHRADGHVIWAHMDQWEGQQWNTSPGNFYSDVRKVHLDPRDGYDITLSLDKTIAPVEVPLDTEWVKHVKIQSRLLTAFWGHPMYIGATVLLPKGYATHPAVHYPTVYVQGHFGLNPPFGFTTEQRPETDAARARRESLGRETGYEFYRSWNSDHFPRMIAVTFQHPTPYFDDSYAVNSVNNGPYGDALLTELVPYLESHFRMLAKPYARVLTGGSTGGWESLALQLYHPTFFNGTWTFYPDPIDFRRDMLIDIYNDDNAFAPPNPTHAWYVPPRFFRRESDGQPANTVEQLSQLEATLGSHGRSGQQLEIWEATYGPIGDDGYPKPLWDKATGKIDHSVADYMKAHGYDLRAYAQENWPKIGPDLVDKLHLYVGDMDNFYLNLAVYLFEDFLKATTHPAYHGSFAYGRPMKGHGWQGMPSAELIREMAAHIRTHAPAGAPTAWMH